MGILVYAIPLTLLVLAFVLGFYLGCDRTFNKAYTIGTLKVAHDENDEKYLAIVIDPLHKDVLEDRHDSFRLIYVEHVFNEESK